MVKLYFDVQDALEMPKKTKQSGKLLSCVWGCGPLDAGESARDHALSCPLNNKYVCTTCLERFNCQASVESHASDKHGWSDKDMATHWRDDRGNEEILKEPAFIPPSESRSRSKRMLPSRESSLESASKLVVPAESGTKRMVEKSRAYSPGSSVASRATRSTECELRELENTLLREKVDLQARQLEAQGKQIETLQQELVFRRQMGERFMSWMDSSMHKPTPDGLPPTPVAQQTANNATNATTSAPVAKSTAGNDSSDATSQVTKKVEKNSTKVTPQMANNATVYAPVAKTTASSGTALSQVLKKNDKPSSKAALDKTGKTPDKHLKGDDKKPATQAPLPTSGKATTSKSKTDPAKKEAAKEKTVVGVASSTVDKLHQKATVVLARADDPKPADSMASSLETRPAEKQLTPKLTSQAVEVAGNATSAVMDSEAVLITDDVDLESTSGASVSTVAPPKSTSSEKKVEKEKETQSHAERLVVMKDQIMEVSFAARGRSEDRGREGNRRDERRQDRGHRRSPSRHGRQHDRSPARRDRTSPRRSPRRSSPSRRSPSRARTQRREPSTNRQSTSTIGSGAVLPRKANMEVVLALEDSEMLELTRGTSLDALFALETKELVRRVQEVKDRLKTRART